jgi:aflatoxin B1 aldehyde reductase
MTVSHSLLPSPELTRPTRRAASSHFGLSDYRVEDVEAVYNHCNENGYVHLTVYQGNHSPLPASKTPSSSPLSAPQNRLLHLQSLAGGFLTKTNEQIKYGAGRFGDAFGGMYSNMYAKPAYLATRSEWEVIARGVGCSKADLAYRWVSNYSPLKLEHGDGIIVGTSLSRRWKG